MEVELHRESIFETAPFASCHASTIERLDDGTFVAAWFGGSREGAGDVGIWLSRRSGGSRRNGGTWSPPRRVAGEQGVPHWNPVLFDAGGGRLLLFYKTGGVIGAWRTMTRVSHDGGETWSAARELVPGDSGGRGPVKNKPIRLADGALLAPASTEEGVWQAFADRSEDDGETWHRSGNIVPALSAAPGERARGVIQPTLWEDRPGCVHMLLRSSEGSIYRSDSSDGGRSWCVPYVTGLPNNNSGIDLAQTAGRLWLVCNPVSVNFGPRTPLTLLSSADGGKTWATALTLEDAPGEYSYPAVIARGDTLYLTYTWRRVRIAFASVRVGQANT